MENWEMLSGTAIMRARAKARKEAPGSVIWGAVVRPDGYGSYIVNVYGEIREKEWGNATQFNEGIMATYRCHDLS